MKKNIAVLPGDGIGPEVTYEAVRVLKAVAHRFNHEFIFDYGLIGAAAIDATGMAFPPETEKLCKQADTVLLGAIGHPRYDNNPAATVRPEQGLLALRKALGLYANIRPVVHYDSLSDNVPLKPEIVKGVDLVVIRELTGGIYFGEKGRSKDKQTAFDSCTYSKTEISQIAELAYGIAEHRNKKVTLVDKANVLETSRLWRETVMQIALKYPHVQTQYMYVDNAAMQLILNPKQFDVLLTENMFGDILTDEASVIAGSLGLLPSASIGKHHSLFEPVHGSYPQAAGKNVANPIGTILSAAMMLEMSFNLPVESAFIYKAVKDIIAAGYLTTDLQQKQNYSTTDVGRKITAMVFEEMCEKV